MKKIYIVLISIAAMMLTVDTYAQISVGAGYNSGINTTKAGGERDSESLGGFYVEGTCDLTFLQKGWGTLALQPGVKFTYYGDTEKEELMGVKSRLSFRETYFDIPVLVKYSYDLPDFSVYGFAGPVFSFGLTSVTKMTQKGDNIDSMWKYYNYSGKTVTKGDDVGTGTIGGKGTDYRAFDTKIGIGVGITVMETVGIKVGYNIGLINRYKNASEFSSRTGVFYVGAAYCF